MKAKICGIYGIFSKSLKRVYIGQSVDVERRLKCHQNKLTKNVHGNSFLQNHFNKYGYSDLEYTTLIIVDSTQSLTTTEKAQIESYFAKGFELFNITTPIDSHKPTQELKQKLSETTRIWMSIPENRNRISQQMRKLRQTNEWRNFVSERMKGNKYGSGYKPTDEWRKACSERMKGNQYAAGVEYTEERRQAQSARTILLNSTPKHKAHMQALGKANGKPIIISKDGIDIYFESALSAAKTLNLHAVSVSLVAKGKQKRTKGYTVRYVEKD